jgi:hypothetical protein
MLACTPALHREPNLSLYTCCTQGAKCQPTHLLYVQRDHMSAYTPAVHREHMSAHTPAVHRDYMSAYTPSVHREHMSAYTLAVHS